MKRRIIISVIVPICAVICALFIGAIFIMLIGKNPFSVYGILFTGTFGNPYGIGQVLFYATPLIFTGLAVSFAFKGGLFNIGCEGQIYIGALLCGWLGWYFREMPAIFLLPICFLGSILGGALWGAIPGILKARTEANEIITTIMLNFIALAFTNYIVSDHFFIPGTVRTPAIGSGAWIPRLDLIIPQFKGSSVNMSFLIALITALAVWYILWYSLLGFEIKAIGHNKEASLYGGINISKNIIITMAISGGIAGMVGINYVMGYKHYFEQGFSGGLGFIGIAVALLGKNNPLGIIISALFFGCMMFGGLLVNSIVPKELVEILQAIVIIFVVIGNTVFSRILLKRK